MPSALIHYFTGTGNSYHAATVVERRLKDAGYSVEWQQVSRGTKPPAGSFDLHLFTFPVYACDIPDIMARYMWKLPQGNNAKAAVIAINGSLHPTTRVPAAQGDPGWSFDHAGLILRLKGYDIVLADAAPYTANIRIVLPIPGEAGQARIQELGDRRVAGLAEKLVRGERSVRHNLLLAFLYVPFGLGYGLVGRHFFAKLYVADGKCNGCGTCVKTCPAGVIKLTAGRPGWDWRCQGCMRCINICPRRAINTSIPRVVLLLGILLVPPEWFIAAFSQAGIVFPSGTGGTILSWAAALLAFIALLYTADKAVFLLERIPLVRSVMAINFNWWYRQYIDHSFRKLLARGKH
ncbi:EFR1 family ferrodoxin [Methanocella sp. MCL-LM]|uniref:EFR1 family ferrodoxin n=1 Tax=Methanocella sp. MCL-LM TaxID=3412035 RepID=UPI003C73DD56